MATVTTHLPNPAPDTPLYRISLDQYHRMGESGLLAPDDRVVLLDGLLVKKMSKGPRHSTATGKSLKSLEAVIPLGWHVRKDEPVSLTGGPEGADSEPEPDLAVVRGGNDAYTARHPGSADVALIVEVADSSLAQDRAGLRRYAWASIPCVWIINLIDGTIEVYSGPSGPSPIPAYAQRTDHVPGEAPTLLIDGTAHGPVAAGDLLADQMQTIAGVTRR